jgi:hypothetical protein
MHEPPEIIASPRTDIAFAAEAKRLAPLIPPELTVAEALAWYEHELRLSYPNAVVREQDALARTESAPYRVWYASNRPRPFRIATTFSVPVAVDRAFGIYVDRVAEWQTAIRLRPAGGATEGTLVGRTWDATYRFLGISYAGRLLIRDAEPPNSVTYEASGSGITVWYTTAFASRGPEETTVAVRGDYDLPSSMLSRIADRLHLERTIGRDIERANASYARLCATEAAPGPASPALETTAEPSVTPAG